MIERVDQEPVKLDYRTAPPEPGPVTEADLGPTRTSIAVIGVIWFTLMALACLIHIADAVRWSLAWPWGTCAKLVGIGLPGLAATVIAFKTRRPPPEADVWEESSD
jgi:hypothetical protein